MLTNIICSGYDGCESKKFIVFVHTMHSLGMNQPAPKLGKANVELKAYLGYASKKFFSAAAISAEHKEQN